MGASGGGERTIAADHQTRRQLVTVVSFDHAPKPPTSLDPHTTIVAAVELSKKTWLIAGHVPGLERRPLTRTDDHANGLLRILTAWRKRGEQAGRTIARSVVAFEAGRDGFWLPRWLRRNGIEAYVIHPSSIPVPRGARAKTDRLDTGMLLRAFSAWLRGEADACRMVAIPFREQEDLRRSSRERADLVTERTRLKNRIRSLLTWHGLNHVNPNTPATRRNLAQLRTAEDELLPPNACAELERLLERLELVKKQIKMIEASYLHPTPEGIAGAGDYSLAAVARRLLRQLALGTTQWYRDRVAKANSAGRKTFIVALARKLLIALWRFVQTGEVPEGMHLVAA